MYLVAVHGKICSCFVACMQNGGKLHLLHITFRIVVGIDNINCVEQKSYCSIILTHIHN